MNWLGPYGGQKLGSFTSINNQYTWLYLNLPRLVPKQWGQTSVIQRSEHQPPKKYEKKFTQEYNKSAPFHFSTNYTGKEIHARILRKSNLESVPPQNSKRIPPPYFYFLNKVVSRERLKRESQLRMDL